MVISAEAFTLSPASKRTSRLVRMPTSLPEPFSTTGKPEMRRWALIWRISARVVSGWMVSGLITMPLSNRFTSRT